jgi:hypothetical protein
MLSSDLALGDMLFVETLGVPAGLGLPVGDGAFIQAIGGDNGLQGAAVGKQREDDRGQLQGFMQAVEGGVTWAFAEIRAAQAARFTQFFNVSISFRSSLGSADMGLMGLPF